MQNAAKNGQTLSMGGSVLWRHVTAAIARRAADGDGGTAAVAPRLPSVRSPERALANAIGRAAGRAHGMPLFFDRVEFSHAVLAELPELFPEQPLISVVAGPAEALGVVAICPGLLASLIEMQAMGRVSSRAAAARRPTRADGAICADFINACLAELGEELATLPGCEGLQGYCYASFLDAPRPLELMLDEVRFHLLSIRLRAGDAGQRNGCIVIALPVAAVAARPPGAEIAASSTAPLPLDSGVGAVSLAEAVRSVPIDMVGVLCRRMMSLGEIRTLSPGAMIALPPGVLGAATVETATGQILYRGKLGELAGRHAMRLHAARDMPSPAAIMEQDFAARPPAQDGTAGVPSAAETLHEPPISDLSGPDAFRSPPRAISGAAEGDPMQGDMPPPARAGL